MVVTYLVPLSHNLLTIVDSSLLVDQILFLSRVSKAIPETVTNIEQLILLPEATSSTDKSATRRRAAGGPQRTRQVASVTSSALLLFTDCRPLRLSGD